MELFSGTHSIGKVCQDKGWEVYSLDRDLPDYDKLDNEKKYKSHKHFQEDILTWDYKQYPTGYFDLITASPVCLYWSSLRYCWIGRKMKNKNLFTMEDLQNDINKFGKPMVDKIREIIDYFKPKNFWIENPNSSTMKKYITDIPYVVVDYCKYSDWGYKKRTRFWVSKSIKEKFKPKLCKRDCENVIKINNKYNHKSVLANGYEIDKDGKKILVNTKEKREWYREYKKKYEKEIAKHKKETTRSNKLERYRIPPKLIKELLDCIE